MEPGRDDLAVVEVNEGAFWEQFRQVGKLTVGEPATITGGRVDYNMQQPGCPALGWGLLGDELRRQIVVEARCREPWATFHGDIVESR